MTKAADVPRRLNPGDSASPRQPNRRRVMLGVLGIAAASSCTTGSRPTKSATPPTTGPDSPSAPSTPGETTGTSPPAPGLGDPGLDVVTGPAGGAMVALTFHGAGDLGLTARALAIGRDTGAAFTVFAVGQWLAATPGVGRDITAAGHDLGNHTWSHQPMTQLNLTEATREIQLGADAVTRSIGSTGLLFRPSGTPSSTPTIRAAATACGYRRCVSYDVDPLDYTDPGADLVRTRTLAAVRPGSIVSLHLGHPGTIDALPGILQGLRAAGLTPLTLTRLLTAAT